MGGGTKSCEVCEGTQVVKLDDFKAIIIEKNSFRNVLGLRKVTSAHIAVAGRIFDCRQPAFYATTPVVYPTVSD